MLISSKPLLPHRRYWLLLVTFLWAMVYLPSAYGAIVPCNFRDRTIDGFQLKNWAVPKIPTGSTSYKIPSTITLTLNAKDCPSTGWSYTFGPVMNEQSNSNRRVYTKISSTMTDGVFKGTYQFTPEFSLEATATFSNFQGSNCKPTIEALQFGQVYSDFEFYTPGFKITNNLSTPCTGFTLTETITVVQTADLPWESYGKYCSDPYTSNECRISWWVNEQLWSGMHSTFNLGTYAFYYIPKGEVRLEIWAKYPTIPKPTPIPTPVPSPDKKCQVVVKSAIRRK